MYSRELYIREIYSPREKGALQYIVIMAMLHLKQLAGLLRMDSITLVVFGTL